MKRRGSASGVLAICIVLAIALAGWARQVEGQDVGQQETPGAGSAPSPLEPREVQVVLFMADLVSIDGPNQSFYADVFLAASWQDPELAADTDEPRMFDLEDIWHPTLLIVNERGASAKLPDVARVGPDGSVVYVQRFNGTFATSMDLRRFPLDRQSLRVWIVALRTGLVPVRLTPNPTVANLLAESLTISDWSILGATLGEREYTATPTGQGLSGVALGVEVKRQANYYIIQVLIPLAAIVMMAWSVFWIPTSVTPTRVGVVVTTMLTLIAYRFMLANHVPRLPYLTRLDWFMLGATMLVVLTLFSMAGTSYLIGRDEEAVVKKIDRVGRVAYPLVFAVYSLVVWLR